VPTRMQTRMPIRATPLRVAVQPADCAR
jgi:hypothetical protein